MDGLTLTHALEHAKRSLELARSHLRFDVPVEEVPQASHQGIEERVRAQVARVERLLEDAAAPPDPGTLESAANDLDREVAALDEDVVEG